MGVRVDKFLEVVYNINREETDRRFSRLTIKKIIAVVGSMGDYFFGLFTSDTIKDISTHINVKI